MTDTQQLYDHFAHISDVKNQQLIGGGYGLSQGPSFYQHTASSWAVSGQDQSGQWYLYYFIQTDSMLHTAVAGTFKINGYNLDCRLINASGDVDTGTQLIAVTPDTTQGSTSYTTSLSESFSSSVGFFGDTPTANIGNSVSFGHSVSRSIPDITIHNRSMTGDPRTAAWSLGVAEGALAQSDTMEFTAQMLFRVPTGAKSPAAHQLKLVFAVIVEDHDNNGSGYYDRTEAALKPNLGDIQLYKFDDRGCCLTFPALVFPLKTPAIPQAVPA